MSKENNFPIRDIIQLIAKTLIAWLLVGTFTYETWKDMRPVAGLVGIFVLVPALFSLIGSGEKVSGAIGVMLVGALFFMKNNTVLRIGLIVLGLLIVNLASSNCAYNCGLFCGGTRRSVEDHRFYPSSVLRGAFGCLSDGALIIAGLCLAVSPFWTKAFSVGLIFSCIAGIAYIAKFVCNIVYKNFQN